MKHIETRYEVTLRDQYGNEIKNYIANFDGTHPHGKELWATGYYGGFKCYVEFYDKGMDDELYRIGYRKVVKMERVDTYEERFEETL